MQGRCLCRAVSVTIKNPSALPGLELCHCTNCRQSTGALTGTFLLVEKANFVLEGEEHVKMYKGKSEAGNALAWYWCDECGSKVYETSEGFPGEMVVNAGEYHGDRGSGCERGTTMECAV